MYGKIFEDIFQSTLMDHGGDTAYVFMAMIVLSDANGIIKHTDNSLARVICKDIQAVREAIKNLEAQDARSNIKAHDGRRIVPLRELMDDETRGWMVVNKEVYRGRASKEEKRQADRDRMAEKRRSINDVANSRNASQIVADVAHTDTDTDTDRKSTPRKRGTRPKTPLSENFTIGDRVRTWASEKGYGNLEVHFENFVSRCRAKSYTYADWDEGFMGAIRDNWAKLPAGNGSGDHSDSTCAYVVDGARCSKPGVFGHGKKWYCREHEA